MGLYQLAEIRWSGCGLHLVINITIGDVFVHWWEETVEEAEEEKDSKVFVLELCGTVGRASISTGELALSYARPTADG